MVKDIPIFNHVTPQFYFRNFDEGRRPHSVLFTKFDRIFEFYFDTEEIKTLYEFKDELFNQPNFFNCDFD